MRGGREENTFAAFRSVFRLAPYQDPVAAMAMTEAARMNGRIRLLTGRGVGGVFGLRGLEAVLGLGVGGEAWGFGEGGASFGFRIGR